ncbi:undecaprenyldiphospho-muramoylpentapeptide beta-N-acetylglucosaminyltransferase [Thermocrinis sp.]
MSKKFYISGGGTGGHFFPAIALVECITEKKLHCEFVGAERGIEKRLSHLINVEKQFLKVNPFLGSSLGGKLRSLISVFLSSLRLYPKLDPDGVSVVFGGYASLPLGISSILKGNPLFLHEQNSIPSTTNQILSKFAKLIFVSFEHSKRFFPSQKTVKTGLPVRRSLLEGLKLSQKEAREKLKLEDRETLLVMGGSQGASFLNSLAVDIFRRTGFQGIHITGEKEYEHLKQAYKGMPVFVLPFTERMDLIYRASSVAISRAGASSITELSLYGIPSLFIPYPYAVRDHQYYNAKEIEELGGGFVLRQEEAEHSKVLKLLDRLLSDKSEFSHKIKNFADPDACQKIIDHIHNFLLTHS